VHRNIQGNSDIWVLDGARTSRFTFDAAIEGFPVWSPDGNHVVFRSRRKGAFDLYQKSSSGTGPEELLVESPQTKAPDNWSSGGRFFLFESTDPQTRSDLWLLPMADGRPSGEPMEWLKTPFHESAARISPDGRWVAYTSNESGRSEVYIRPFREPTGGVRAAPVADGGDGRWPVSTGGGFYPKWRSNNSRELYYLGPAGEMMAVSLAVTGTTLDLGTPVTLFEIGRVDPSRGVGYDVAPDGRFLIAKELDSDDAPVTLIQHWNPSVR
jgi:Tol biopolymer transport system component